MKFRCGLGWRTARCLPRVKSHRCVSAPSDEGARRGQIIGIDMDAIYQLNHLRGNDFHRLIICDDLSIGENRHARRDFRCMFRMMRTEQNAASSRGQLRKKTQRFELVTVIEPSQWFVHDKDLRALRKRPCNQNQLAFTA